MITGVGDGALIDLFRIKFSGFDLESMYKRISKNQEKFNKLKSFLVSVKTDYIKSKNSVKNSNWLFKKFQTKLHPADYDFIFRDYFEKKELKDVEVILNGTQSNFEEILNLDKMSMINAFLIFVLSQYEVFTYMPGKCILKGNVYSINGKPVRSTVIVRHGTKREELLKEIQLTQDEIDDLRKRQKNTLYDINSPLWTFSDLHYILKKELPKVSFYTSETVSLFSSFAAVLSKILSHQYKNEKQNFRVAIFRIVEEDKNFFNTQDSISYQQITKYYGGSNNSGPSRDIGRIFGLELGNVGMSIRTGNSILIENKNEEKFSQLTNSLGLKRELIYQGLKASISIPIFAKFKGKMAVNLVVFVEAKDDNFFRMKLSN